MRKVAALFVVDDGPYFELEGVDLWPESRDARDYAGPHPVVAHPPCERWGRYWSGGPSASYPRLLGDDGGCFAAALWAVRMFGGVVEHPEASHAWRWHGLERPEKSGSWTDVDTFGGCSCCVEQGHYGHRARKATWLYAVWCVPFEFSWGPCEGKARIDPGFHSTKERRQATHARRVRPAGQKRLIKDENLATPVKFRDLLLELARGSVR